jgi:hypothetical protein
MTVSKQKPDKNTDKNNSILFFVSIFVSGLFKILKARYFASFVLRIQRTTKNTETKILFETKKGSHFLSGQCFF